MKSFIRKFVFSLISLYVASKIIAGFKMEENFYIFIKNTFLFTILNFFIKPVIKILTLPLTFISLGIFSLFINALTLYLLTYVSSGIKITAWNFPGLSYAGFVIPAYNFSSLGTLFISSLIISFIINFLSWLYER